MRYGLATGVLLVAMVGPAVAQEIRPRKAGRALDEVDGLVKTPAIAGKRQDAQSRFAGPMMSMSSSTDARGPEMMRLFVG
jgi:hypothetical protein